MCTNNQEKSIFLVKLENVIKAYEDADELYDEFNKICDELPAKISNIDLRRSDLLHRYTNGDEMTNDQHIALSKALEALEKERRCIYDMEWVSATWDNHKKKVTSKENRPFLRQEIKNRLAKLDNEYKPRVYSYAEIEQIINVKPEQTKTNACCKKRGRKVGTRNLSRYEQRQIVQEVLGGKSPEDVAIEKDISVARIKRFLKNEDNYIGAL